MPPRLGSAKLLLLLLGPVLLAGCYGLSHNPSYFPALLPPGDIVRTHAKPPGHGYFTNFDPHACKLVVRPVLSASPARSQQVFIATVYDEKGQPRRHRRVEWMIEGPGNIVEVDESGLLPGRGYKVDNKYAVSYTDYFEHRITRGNADPNDDFVIRPGQSWCVVSSAVEGDTHLTVYAPEIHNWEASRVYVTHHWVNARFACPTAAACPAGGRHTFTTSISRPTDNQPLAGYRVRYRILDGPPAVLLPVKGKEAVTVSDLRGKASVTIAQVKPGGGSNRVAVEIIRAPDPTATSDAGMVVSRTETRIDWLAPAVALNVEGPATARVGQEVQYTLAVNNTGRLETKSLTVRSAVPAGLTYVRSDPPAIVEGKNLIWTLGELKEGKVRNLQAVFRTTRAEQIKGTVSVRSEEGLTDERSFLTLVTKPALKMKFTGPATGTVGVPIVYQLTLTNPGTGSAANVVLNAELDDGLDAGTKTQKIELHLNAIEGGQSQAVPLTLVPRKTGKLAVRIIAKADGGLTDRGQHSVEVRDARVTLRLAGPNVRYVGRTAKWALLVANAGQVPLSNVVVRDLLPLELQFVSASDGGQLVGREVVWNVGALKAGEERRLNLETKCVTVAQQTVNRAAVTADPVSRVETSADIQVRGLPAFRIDVKDRDDPLEVGKRTVYTIEVSNQGTVPGKQVQVVATVPPQMRLENASGPATYKVAGQKVTFTAIDGLGPGQTWKYSVEVTALKPGDARFQVELKSSSLSDPVVAQQSTTVFASPGGRPVPATR